MSVVNLTTNHCLNLNLNMLCVYVLYSYSTRTV
jgi:hypothetical protein